MTTAIPISKPTNDHTEPLSNVETVKRGKAKVDKSSLACFLDSNGSHLTYIVNSYKLERSTLKHLVRFKNCI